MGKIAVVYWSGTGNTEAMASAVAEGAKEKGAEQLEEGEFEPMFSSCEGKLGGKKIGLFGSYGWGDGEWMRTWQETCETDGAALVGPSGSGKSAIAKLIAVFWDVKDGTVSMGGVDEKKIPLEQLYDQVAFVSQDNYLFETNVRENIRMGRLSASDKEVEAAAKAAGCDAFIRSLEKGYETNVGGGGAHLSGGERQRIAIAKAMLKDAPIVILDEATANLDPENEDRLQKAIEELTWNKTIIMIAHRLKTVRNADQILVVDEGKIVQKGKHEELIGQKGIYADFVLGRKEAIGWKLAQ